MACITTKRGRLVIDFYDQHGKRRLKTLPVGMSKTDAKKALREIEDQVDRGTYMPKSRIPVFSDVADGWLQYKKQNIRESTHMQYHGHVEKHLKPHFGVTRINRINFDAIEKYMDQATKQEITPPTLKKILITLGGILKYATQKRYIEFNPIREIEKPKGRGSSWKKVDFLKPSEIRAFIEDVQDQKYKTLFTLAVMSGMRQGELLGLKWTDIDWFNHQVHVKEPLTIEGSMSQRAKHRGVLLTWDHLLCLN
jgi:integrase